MSTEAQEEEEKIEQNQVEENEVEFDEELVNELGDGSEGGAQPTNTTTPEDSVTITKAELKRYQESEASLKALLENPAIGVVQAYIEKGTESSLFAELGTDYEKLGEEQVYREYFNKIETGAGLDPEEMDAAYAEFKELPAHQKKMKLAEYRGKLKTHQSDILKDFKAQDPEIARQQREQEAVEYVNAFSAKLKEYFAANRGKSFKGIMLTEQDENAIHDLIVGPGFGMIDDKKQPIIEKFVMHAIVADPGLRQRWLKDVAKRAKVKAVQKVSNVNANPKPNNNTQNETSREEALQEYNKEQKKKYQTT